jgi:hypothetical protein
MAPTIVCCPNLVCPARGPTGQGKIGLHARKDRLCICTQGGKTCAATHGTVFYRRRTAAETVALVGTLIAPLDALHQVPTGMLLLLCLQIVDEPVLD